MVKKSAGKALKKKWLTPLYKWSRTLHIYVSAALFALLIMFCITGITLNHAEWFSSDYTEGDITLSLPAGIAQQLDTAWTHETDLPVDAVISEIKRHHQRLPKPSNSHVDYELQEISIDYQLPAGYASALIIDDVVEITYRTGGFVSVINDLHKGRHTGVIWRWVIDISAVLMLLFAITGLVLMIQNKKRRQAGLWVTLLGIATPVILFVLFVPQF